MLIGLILPGLIELYYVAPALLYRREFTAPRYMDMMIAAAVREQCVTIGVEEVR